MLPKEYLLTYQILKIQTYLWVVKEERHFQCLLYGKADYCLKKEKQSVNLLLRHSLSYRIIVVYIVMQKNNLGKIWVKQCWNLTQLTLHRNCFLEGQSWSDTCRLCKIYEQTWNLHLRIMRELWLRKKIKTKQKNTQHIAVIGQNNCAGFLILLKLLIRYLWGECNGFNK